MAACSCPPTCAPPESVLDVVKQLIDKGADVSAITRKRMTALMFACNSGNLEVVRLLLPLSDKFATDNQGWNVRFTLSWRCLTSELAIFVGAVLGCE